MGLLSLYSPTWAIAVYVFMKLFSFILTQKLTSKSPLLPSAHRYEFPSGSLPLPSQAQDFHPPPHPVCVVSVRNTLHHSSVAFLPFCYHDVNSLVLIFGRIIQFPLYPCILFLLIFPLNFIKYQEHPTFHATVVTSLSIYRVPNYVTGYLFPNLGLERPVLLRRRFTIL